MKPICPDHPSTRLVYKMLLNNAGNGVHLSDFRGLMMEGQVSFGFRLAARIQDLRDAGFKIVSKKLEDKTAVYYLVGDQ